MHINSTKKMFRSSLQIVMLITLHFKGSLHVTYFLTFQFNDYNIKSNNSQDKKYNSQWLLN